MNPTRNIDPLLRAVLDDDAWRARSRETQVQAALRLSRRRCWRKVRAGLLAIPLVAAMCWLVGVQPRPRQERRVARSEVPAFEQIGLHLALNLPRAADGALSVRAYEPLPEWTLHCEPLAEVTHPMP
jgi:hypothetical protein